MPTLDEALGYLATVTIIGSLVLFTPLWAPKLVYFGIEARQPFVRPESIRSFSLSDLSCAFVIVGVANALFNLIRTEYEVFPVWRIVMPVFCNLIAVLTWWLSLQFAKEKCVKSNGARIATILFFFPAAFIAVTHVVASVMGLFTAPKVDDRTFVHPAFLCFAVLLALSVACLLALRKAFRRLLDRQNVDADL